MQRDFDDVEVLLDMWADWMHRPEPITEGYPSKAAGGFVPSWCKDTEESAESADAETVARVNAAYDSLSRYFQEAISSRYSLGSRVWRFPNGGATFEDAKVAIRPLLVKKRLL